MRRPQITKTRNRDPELDAARRRIAIRVIVRQLEGWRSGGAESKRGAPAFEGRRLHSQPWRRPRRPDSSPISILEEIRRFEARARAH